MRVPFYSVIIAGVNDATATNGTSSGSRAEDHNVTKARGVLTESEANVREAPFRIPPKFTGNYGSFTFDEVSGSWTDTLDNSNDDATPGVMKITPILYIIVKPVFVPGFNQQG